MKTEEVYQPISCDFHDHLLALATKAEYIQIHFYDEIGALRAVDAIIKDVYTKGKEEFAVLSTGEQVRLDKLVRVAKVNSPLHGNSLDYSCNC